ncbi:MAG TPA: RHS repeat-associated core domain-containing protein [Gammaproteobacteria bacterium]|nr:RHS repeat-associated core domain-containing protein [Gammaproteobacteria bacterium]
MHHRWLTIALLCGGVGLSAAVSANTEVGAIPGSFAVSSTGAATYSIPINLPPGVAGLTPHLALVYSSQLGNGLAGYGWTVSGLSVITVCNKTYAQDSVNQNVSFAGTSPDTNDYCLDGAKLLPTSSGANTYRKELDDFSQITTEASGGAGPTPTLGPQWFEVQTSDGLTYEYGKTADSEIVAAGPGILSSVTMVRAWALDQIYDKYGNSISFTYSQDTADGDFWPTQITYTNHGGSTGPHTVVFKYTSLSSISPGLVWTNYFAGALISQTERLNEIDVDYNGSTTFAYTLGYDDTLTDGNGNTGTERSRLTSVNECAGSICYPATTINWQSGTSGWGGANEVDMGGSSLTSTQASEIELMDVNGDGRTDIVYPGANYWMVMLANGNGFDAPQSTGIGVNSDAADALPIDALGDGHTGLLVPQENSSSTLDWYLLKISVSSGGTVSATYTDTGLAAIGVAGNATVLDVNGDGLPDIVYSDGTNLDWYQNLGDGNFSTSATLDQGAFSSSNNNYIQRERSFSGGTPDFDGTGRGGFMTYTEISGGIPCTPDYCPPPTAPYPKWGIAVGGSYNTSPTGLGGITGDSGDLVIPMFVDFNGDGITDLLYAPHTSPQDTAPDDWYVYDSTGAGLTGGDTGVAFDANAMLDSLAVDYAGNGREDLMLQLWNSSTCTGLGLVGYAGGVFHGDKAISLAGEGPCASGYDSGSFRAADITGDGLQDLIWVANGAVYYALHNGVKPDLVTTISNGFSQTYNITYAPLSNTSSAIYTPGNTTSPTQTYSAVGGTATVPEARDYTGPLYVVSAYTTNDGVGGTVDDSFSYAGALLGNLGRGFLGFASTTATDSRASVNTTSVKQSGYDQFFPLTGDPTSVALLVNGNTEKSVSTTWTPAPTLGSAQYVYASSTSTSDYELGSSTPYRTVTTATTPTISSGVMTQEVATTTTAPATVNSSTTTTFQIDTGNWCLDLPASVTVENTGENSNSEGGTNPITRTITYTPDTSHCRVTSKSVSVSDNGTSETLETDYDYDPTYGNLQQQTVKATTNGSTTSYQTGYGYDPTNTFVASVTQWLNATNSITSKATWDPTLGTELSATDPNGVTTSFHYDPFGLKQSENLGDGTSVQWSYCLPANGCSVSGGAYSITATHYSTNSTAGKTETTVYDTFGRPLLQSTYVVGGGLSNVASAYDALGRVTSVSTPYEGSPSTYTYTAYDTFSRPRAVYAPAGQNSGCSTSYNGETTCETSYGYNGLTTTVTDPRGNATTKTADALGEVVTMTDAQGGNTYYVYDPFGDLTQTTDAKGDVTHMAYDTLGRKLQMIDPDMDTWNYGYDPRGLLTSQTDPKGQLITMQYDALGRLNSRTEPLASGGTGTDTWTYDGPNGVPTAPDIGKLVEAQGADGYIKQYQYDNDGRPEEQDVTIAGSTYATNTAYDSFGRVASITYPSTPTPDADDPPVAVVGANQTALVGETVTLNGSGSYDPDHGPQPLTYKWAQTSGPVDTSADGATTANVSFSTTTAGTYDFTLTVSDGELTDSASTSVTITPAQVAGLSASTVDPNTGDFTLSWSGAEGATSYSIEQSTNGNAYSLLPQSWSGTSAALTGYSNGNYSFAVQGCGNDACGAFSSPVSVAVLRTPGVPAAPSVTPATTTNGSFALSWSQPAGTVTYYELYTSFNGGAYSAQNVGNVRSTNVSETVNGTYDFEVAACNSAACSSPSSPTAGMVSLPVPAAPTLCCSATITQGQSTTLSWTPNGGVSATYYELESSLSSTFSSPAQSNMGLATSTTVSPRATHYYRVEACNTAGCGSWSGSAEVLVQISGCRTCTPTTSTSIAPNATTGTPAPSATSNSGGGFAVLTPPPKIHLAQTSFAPLRHLVGTRAIPAQNPASSYSGRGLAVIPSHERDTDANTTVASLAALRRQALQVEAVRVASEQRRNQPAPQPLYAAEVEMPNGTLVGMATAVAEGKVNPYRLAVHLRRTGTPSRYTVNFNYDAHGNLIEVVDAANSNLIYWQATSGDAFGQVTGELLGNGVINTYGFDPNTGALTTLLSGVGSSTTIANMSYQWDGDGNLTKRADNNAGLTETFTYDSLNRLYTSQINSNPIQQYGYDAVGDITSRPGVGTYNYNDASHPMQITSITASSGTTRNFSYDADGNTTSDGVHNYTWDALNRMTQSVDSATSSSVQIAYTPGGARYSETTTVGATSTTLTEVNGLFEVEGTSSYTYYRERIPGGNGIVAIRTIRNDGILTTRYITGDHLGSVSEITDEVGDVDERMSYGPFGERRDPATWQPYTTIPDLTDVTDKGYTGQQQMDAVGLVHMNGRVYDPAIGRMISADPTVPDPFDSQSFNRYAYVENNPLSAIDPSGFCSQMSMGNCPNAPNTTPVEVCNGPCYAASTLDPIAPFNDDVIDSAATTDIAPFPTELFPDSTVISGALPVDTSLPAITGGNLSTPANPVNPNLDYNPNCNCHDPYGSGSTSNYQDGFLAGDCGVACGQGGWQSVGSLGDLTNWGPSNGHFPSPHNPVEIPGPSGNCHCAPVAGASHPLGSWGMPLGATPVILLPTQAVLTTRQVAIIILNETANMGGPELDSFRFSMALSLINADRIWGPRRPIFARTASDSLASWYSPSLHPLLNKIMGIVGEAQIEETLLGIDPTGGATNYNMRNSLSITPPPWGKNLIFDGAYGPFTGPYKYGYVWLNPAATPH